MKSKLHNHSSMSTVWLAGMDSTYLICYAIGNIISGVLEDRYPLYILISSGLLCSGLVYSVIVFLGYADIYIPLIFVFVWALQGIFQSTVVPGCVALLGNWFEKDKRGRIMGIWGTANSLGNIVGALLGGVIINSGQS